MEIRDIHLSADQVRTLAKAIKLKLEETSDFAEAVENAINRYRVLRVYGVYQPSVAKDQLTQAADAMSGAIRAIENLVFKKLNQHSANSYLATRLIEPHLRRGAKPVYTRAFLETVLVLKRLKRAANAALSSEIFESKGRTKNVSAKWLVSTLALAYHSATGKQPGRGRDTYFYHFTKLCFEYAGHEIEDPFPYIKAVLPSSKKR
jgi:hypothetical protein